LTKKDYVLIAAVMAGNKCTTSADAVRKHEADCRAMAAALAGTNPLFDRTRFLTACGVQS